MRRIETIKSNEDLYEVIAITPVHRFTRIHKDQPDKIHEGMLGLWVDHLNGDRVVKREDNLLILKLIEEAQVIQEEVI